jgi:hypothetical protein
MFVTQYFFSGIDFWRMLCLFLIETSFALSRLDRRSPSLIFDLPLSVGNFHSFFFFFFFFFLFFFFDSLPQSFLTCPSLWFLSFSPRLIVGLLFFAFPLSIDSNIVFIFANKNLLFAPSVGCDPS